MRAPLRLCGRTRRHRGLQLGHLHWSRCRGLELGIWGGAAAGVDGDGLAGDVGGEINDVDRGELAGVVEVPDSGDDPIGLSGDGVVGDVGSPDRTGLRDGVLGGDVSVEELPVGDRA